MKYFQTITIACISGATLLYAVPVIPPSAHTLVVRQNNDGDGEDPPKNPVSSFIERQSTPNVSEAPAVLTRKVLKQMSTPPVGSSASTMTGGSKPHGALRTASKRRLEQAFPPLGEKGGSTSIGEHTHGNIASIPSDVPIPQVPSPTTASRGHGSGSTGRQQPQSSITTIDVSPLRDVPLEVQAVHLKRMETLLRSGQFKTREAGVEQKLWALLGELRENLEREQRLSSLSSEAPTTPATTYTSIASQRGDSISHSQGLMIRQPPTIPVASGSNSKTTHTLASVPYETSENLPWSYPISDVRSGTPRPSRENEPNHGHEPVRKRRKTVHWADEFGGRLEIGKLD